MSVFILSIITMGVNVLVSPVAARLTVGPSRDLAGQEVSNLEDFPAYCLKAFSQQEVRKIEGLDDALAASLNAKLVQVQAVIRHGARTTAAKYNCWEGYAGIQFQCPVTQLERPSAVRDSYKLLDDEHRIFRKIYRRGRVNLKGNCHVGQLLEEGLEQCRISGDILRNAYVATAAEGGGTKLFVDGSVPPLHSDDFFLSSDDQQRTIMSGQALMDAFLPLDPASEVEVVPWNTGDFDIDSIYPNEYACPRLKQLGEDARVNDTQFLEWKASSEQEKSMETMKSIFTDTDAGGDFNVFSAFDCLMTTRCTNQPLPQEVSEEVYAGVIQQAEYPLFRKYSYNRCAYARLAMAPLFADIRFFMQSAIERGSQVYPKFTLFSGHDTTVMPFLAAFGNREMFPDAEWVWDGKWVPYASMVLLELWEVDAQNMGDEQTAFVVRMLFQGKQVPIPGCSAVLCPVDEFLQLTSFAEDAHLRRGEQCQIIPLEGSEPFPNGGDTYQSSVVPMDIDFPLMLTTTALLGMLIGGVLTLLVTRKVCGSRFCGGIGNLCSGKKGYQHMNNQTDTGSFGLQMCPHMEDIDDQGV